MVIQTADLIIRYLQHSDLESLYSYRSDPRLAKFQCYEPMSRSGIKGFIDEFANKAFGEE